MSDDPTTETPELIEAMRAALDDIESRELGDRAGGYRSLADGLRAELEQSDPSRSAG
ncbi:hypothetical protein ACWKWP_13190 [Agromyces soli]